MSSARRRRGVRWARAPHRGHFCSHGFDCDADGFVLPGGCRVGPSIGGRLVGATRHTSRMQPSRRMDFASGIGMNVPPISVLRQRYGRQWEGRLTQVTITAFGPVADLPRGTSITVKRPNYRPELSEPGQFASGRRRRAWIPWQSPNKARVNSSMSLHIKDRDSARRPWQARRLLASCRPRPEPTRQHVRHAHRRLARLWVPSTV
jgi:hypothetical protein